MGLLDGRVVVAVGMNMAFQPQPGLLVVTQPRARPPVTQTVGVGRAWPDPRDERVLAHLTAMVSIHHPDRQLHRRLVPCEDGGLVWHVIFTRIGGRAAEFRSPLLAEALLDGLLSCWRSAGSGTD